MPTHAMPTCALFFIFFQEQCFHVLHFAGRSRLPIPWQHWDLRSLASQLFFHLFFFLIVSTYTVLFCRYQDGWITLVSDSFSRTFCRVTSDSCFALPRWKCSPARCFRMLKHSQWWYSTSIGAGSGTWQFWIPCLLISCCQKTWSQDGTVRCKMTGMADVTSRIFRWSARLVDLVVCSISIHFIHLRVCMSVGKSSVRCNVLAYRTVPCHLFGCV